MMDAVQALLTLSDAYAAATGLAEGTISDRVLHGGNRLRDLRAGSADIGVRRAERAIRWFSENWPADTDWPKGVARPAQAEATP